MRNHRLRDIVRREEGYRSLYILRLSTGGVSVQELGDLLREARLEKGLSLEEVENLTKIRKRYLEAIEKGEYKVLPGSFYVRAFVKSYAETVGLDAEQVLRLYRNVIPDPGSAVQSDIYPTKRRRRRNVNTEKWSKVASTLVFLCFLVVVVGVIYYYWVRNADPRDQVDENVPITQSEDYGDDDNKLSEPPSQPEPVVTPAPQPEPEPEPEPELAKIGTEQGADVYVLKNSDKLYIRMESMNADCWYAVYDGGYFAQQIDMGTIRAGESKDYEFAEAAHFHLGYAKTVKLTVNGIEFKPSEYAGKFHVVIRLDRSESQA